jgi:hypothetical protein
VRGKERREKRGECGGWEGCGEGKNVGSVGNECDTGERPTLIPM